MKKGAPETSYNSEYSGCGDKRLRQNCSLRSPPSGTRKTLCEKALKNMSLDYDTGYYRKKTFEKEN